MSDSAETPSSSNTDSSTSSTSVLSPPSPQSPPDSNSTSPPPSSDNSNSPPSSSPATPTPPPSQPPQSPPPSPPPQATPPSPPPQSPPPSPPPQSPPLSPPPQSPPPSSSPQTPAPASTPPPPPTEQQKHAPAPSSTPNGNGNDNTAASGGNSPPPPAVFSPPPPAVAGNPPSPSGLQSPPNAQVSPPPTPKARENSSPDTRLAAPTGSPRGDYRTTQQSPSISTLSPTEPTSHTIENSNQNSESSGSKNRETIKIGTGVAVAGAVIIVIIAVLFLVIKRRKKKPTNVYAADEEGYLHGKQAGLGYYGMQGYHSSGGNGSQKGNMYHGPFKEATGIGNSQVAFTYEQVMKITNSFSQQNVIGGGGFGPVYKGFLPDGRPVAVKQLKAGSGQGEREFRAEVEIISRVHHRHLVSLVGYCICKEQRLLIYEFVPNNTLEHHLHGNGMPVLEWSKRLKVAIGAAKGLSYLHDDCHPKIIHRDIKSANILLDEAFEAKVADFGLAKLANDAYTHVSTRVMGTFGYMAPEYASSGKLTDKSDVFSFGVVLLELVTGRKSVDPSQPLGEESLVEWARPYLYNAIETRDLSKLVDPRLENNYVEDEMFRMIESAAACIRHSAPKRPRILQVTRALDSEAAMNDLSNGFKYGQSTIYDSAQYNQDILRFTQMVQGSSEFDMSSGEHISRDSSQSQ